MLVVGIAFLGGYVWGLQYLMRRHVLSDLTAEAFYVSVLRMATASIVAFVFFNAFHLATDLLSPGSSASPGGGSEPGAEGASMGQGTWAAIAFLIGIFPQRGVDWLTQRIPVFARIVDPSVTALPLEMVQGVSAYDKIRLEELGVESCYDLATADLIPLLLKSSYGARELTDWILQAKLCVFCGAAVRDLRAEGIRWVTDLSSLEDSQIDELAQNTNATRSSLSRAREAGRDKELQRLLQVSYLISEFAPLPGKDGPPPPRQGPAQVPGNAPDTRHLAAPT